MTTKEIYTQAKETTEAQFNNLFNSQHLTGQALDLDFGNKADNKALFDYIRHNLMFDQVINENDYSWIHVSYNGAFNRREVLEMKKVNGKSTYTKL